jgi:hypothetical protein
MYIDIIWIKDMSQTLSYLSTMRIKHKERPAFQPIEPVGDRTTGVMSERLEA